MSKYDACPLHEDWASRIEKLEGVVNGENGEQGLVTKFAVVCETLSTIKKAVYTIIGLTCITVFLALTKLVIHN